MFCQSTATFFSPELSETRHTNNVQIFIISEAIQHVFLSIIPLFVKNKWQQIIFHERPNTFDIICLEKSKYHLALSIGTCHLLINHFSYNNSMKDVLSINPFNVFWCMTLCKCSFKRRTQIALSMNS